MPGPASAVEQPSSSQAPSPGFCAADSEPLANLTEDRPQIPSLPRKRPRLQGRTFKIMKEAYKGIQWTCTFVTGPLDPEHNMHKLYCQIRKTNALIYSKGAREIVRHFQCESHFRKDHIGGMNSWGRRTESTVAKSTRSVKNGQILTPLELEKEKVHFMSAPLVKTGCSYPFYDDYMAGLGSVTSQEEVRLCVALWWQPNFYGGSLCPTLWGLACP